ncbi:hypothetical protein BDN67DRAFT_972784 [Paxillus ammoniavirescens]|nr:hypothetical protein BDN67DRAFT_972784 [Paxillus ammoniavirescens]
MPYRLLVAIATTVLMGITATAPFNGTDDHKLAIVYISVFILAFVVSSSQVTPIH